ncbi:protein disulfide-isomerase A4 isoform X1 [Talpa occidentalis]|uniref:protein disulfide-isomerase A4 isoform X1 n=1 Tax=Talpa occidentalis TaxID=50954 RepID=UPI00188F053E|nr:protein disulfide-isomerase A4 isoform X1 [Talpa occidentalis]
MRPRKACLLALLLALAQLLAAAGARGPDDDANKEDAMEDEDEEEDEDEDEDLEVKEENGVFVLKDANFDDFVADKDTVLLEFYAPWCGHCKQFAPEYEKIASTLKENDPPIPVAKIDATAESGLASRFDVSGYPTIKILKKGQAVDYEGSRTQDEIVAKVKEVSQPNWTPPPEVTLVLTKDNFDEVVSNADIILVEFYAPWCGHCKKLAPEYEKAAKELSKRSPPIPLAKVDATTETDLAKKFDVSGYPTLKIFRKGKPFDYNGPREKYGIVDYMIEQSGPPSKEIPTLKQVQELLKDGDDVLIIGVFQGESDLAYQLYQEAANNLREDYRFQHTFSTDIAKFLKVSTSKLVMMQPEKFRSKYEPKSRVMDIQQGSTEGSAIKDYVLKHALPLVGHRRTSNDAKRYSKRPLVVVYYSVDFSFDYRAATQFWRNKVLEVAKDFPEYTFAVADEDDFATEVKDLGLSESGEDVNAAILDEGGRKFAMEPDEFDSDALREFVTAFKKGKLKPVIKSQPVPKNNKGPVKVVVGKTFDSIVMDPKKDVLIEFYAPWCGHCKQLEPVYAALGKKYKGHKNLVIAKMDATANDITHDRYKVEGFPTIYFAPSGDKKNPIKFEDGNRDLEQLSKFVEEHATQLSRTREEL